MRLFVPSTHPAHHLAPTANRRIYWALGGSYRVEREHCLSHLLDAAAEEGPQQAEAFEWLGHWYSQVAGDEFRARKCYQRALALNPTLVRRLQPSTGLCCVV